MYVLDAQNFHSLSLVHLSLESTNGKVRGPDACASPEGLPEDTASQSSPENSKSYCDWCRHYMRWMYEL